MVMMTVSEARAVLPDLLSRVESGEEVTITRLAGAASAAPPEGPGLTPARAEELVAEIRAGRDAR